MRNGREEVMEKGGWNGKYVEKKEAEKQGGLKNQP